MLPNEIEEAATALLEYANWWHNAHENQGRWIHPSLMNPDERASYDDSLLKCVRYGELAAHLRQLAKFLQKPTGMLQHHPEKVAAEATAPPDLRTVGPPPGSPSTQ